MKLTANQQLAIEIKDSNVLVSAAAGSGKTSVLVERIVKKITRKDKPTDIDRMLIMTFTNAAAAEMQSRIRDSLSERMEEALSDDSKDDGKVENLRRQSLLVHKALITTIHGFCKTVITEHFEKLSLDPSFRVADENECKLLRQDAIDACLESAYEKGDDAFLKLTECLSDGKSDSSLEDVIIPLYEFIMADPDPERFMKKCCEAYSYESFEEYASSDVVSHFEEQILHSIRNNIDHFRKMEELINEYDVLEPYRDNVSAYLELFSSIADKALEDGICVYDMIRDRLGKFDPPPAGRVYSKKLGADEAEAKEMVGLTREMTKGYITRIRKMMTYDLRLTYEQACHMRPVLEALCDLINSFKESYTQIKREKNVIDFSDMEHMAVEILEDADIAEQYRERFEEIYVDEYQDSNLIQEYLVSLICRNDPGNVFQVGDVKQSIYRFRQARPDLFLSKYNTYSDTAGGNRRILLNDNFRSRRQVTDAVNEVFERIMKADLGGIEYDADARLYYGATYYDTVQEEEDGVILPPDDDIYRCELLIPKTGTMKAEEMQANIVAKRIIEMIRDGFPVYDRKEKIMRPVSYKDFTILTRSHNSFESVFRDVFAGANIPLAVTGREGYFATVEVQTALAFLSSVDNPQNDIPLATFAKSPVGRFTDTDLATLTAKFTNRISLYDRVCAAIKEEQAQTTDETLKDKCRRLKGLIDDYRVMSTYTPVHDVLTDFIDRHYGDYVRCMSKGPQRMANLNMLLSKAGDFGKTGYKGIYQFNRYIEQIKKYNIDDGEALTVSENDDVVRMMTMHASKGLEFPVCFIVNLEKKMNRLDEYGKIIRSANKGIGIDYIDLDRRIANPTLCKQVVRLDNRQEAIAEEMRVLYVAMTRAREKLIMVGRDSEEEFGERSAIPEMSASFIEMLKAAYCPGGFKHIDISYISEEDLTASRVEEDIRQKAGAEELLELAVKSGSEDTQTGNEELAGLAYKYPYPIYPDLKAKFSVSELKKMASQALISEEDDLWPNEVRLFEEVPEGKYIPKFMRHEDEKAAGGSFYGSAFHRIMELWDYTGIPEKDRNSVTKRDVEDFTAKMLKKHRIGKNEADAVRPGDVAYFLNSPLGKQMKAAASKGVLYREQPFVIGVPDRGETILIQGIIDAYFTEDDGITVVDYKTDRADDEEILIKRYSIQLNYYKEALRRITGRPIKELVIYSTSLRRRIDVPFVDRQMSDGVLN